MNAPRSTRRGQGSVAAFALVAVVGIAGAVVLLRISGATAAAPTASPSAAPTTPPIWVPSLIPTPPPASPDAAPGSVDLDNASGHDVKLLIHDQTGDVVGAESGTPGDGMSVGWHKAIVEKVGETSIRVTWVGFPGDDTIDLGVSGTASDYTLTIVQPGPYANTDALGEDRVVVLEFDAPVAPGEVTVDIIDRTSDY